MRFYLNAFLVFLLTLNIVFASPTINIDPGIFDVNLYGGESILKNLTITANGFETSIIIDLYTNITANDSDTDGFNVNFSETRFILDNNQPKNIIMNISTAPNLKPDTFKIIIRANTQIQRETEIVYRSRGRRTKTVYIENKTNQTIYLNKTEYIPFYINQTKEVPVDRFLNQIVFVENTTQINELKQLAKDQHEFILILLSFITLLLCLGILAILFEKK